MATRSSGVSGAIYGLVVFVFLFVIALALSILFYAQRTQTQEQLATAQNDQTRFISTQEQQGDAYKAVRQQADTSRTTVFAQMQTDIQTLKRWLVGSDQPLDQIKAAKESAGVGEGKNALTQIAELQGAVANAENQIKQLQTDLAARTKTVHDLNDQFDNAQKGFAKERETLNSQFATRTTQFDAATKQYESARKDLLADLDKARADATAQAQQLQDKITEMQTNIDKLNGRVRELVGMMKASRPAPPDLTLEPDGRIIDTVPQDNMVYINLGRDDHLILGMTFAVFDESTGIRTEVEPNGRVTQLGSKATIEVIRFGEAGKTAACRVIHQAYGKPIVVGDVISNIIYDRNRVFRFYVFGDFDLDRNGQATAADRERITSLIQQWGGQVITSDNMPVDTDFLILGAEPPLPKAPPDNPPPTPEQIAEYLNAQKKYNRYYELSGQARELSIPILNQNRFLTLIGYYSH